MHPIPVLFVCHENICRSPMAEGLFLRQLRREGLDGRFSAASAGTMRTMVGSPPDARAGKALEVYGVDISSCRAECIDALRLSDYERIFVMDAVDLQLLLDAVEPAMVNRVHLVGQFLPGREGSDIPDPYYGGQEAFEAVCSDLALATAHIAEFLCSTYPHKGGVAAPL